MDLDPSALVLDSHFKPGAQGQKKVFSMVAHFFPAVGRGLQNGPETGNISITQQWSLGQLPG